MLVMFIMLAAPDTLWTKTYGGSNLDIPGRRVYQTSDQGFIIPATTRSFGYDDGALWLIKTDKDGNVEWEKIYEDAPPNDTLPQGALDVKPTGDGYILLGYTTSPENRYDLWLLRTDLAGDTVWTKRLGSTLVEEPYTVLCADDGYVIVAELWTTPIKGYVIKTDLNGDTVWSRLLDGGTKDGVILANGDIVVTGSKPVPGHYADFYLARLDREGNLLWEKTFGYWNGELANGIDITKDSGFILAGYTSSFGGPTTQLDFYIVRVDSSGDLIWDTHIDLTENDYGYSIYKTGDGGFILCGFSGTLSSEVRDLTIVKIDENGDTLWTRVYGGSDHENGFCAKEISDSCYVALGYTKSFGSGDRDIWLLVLGYHPGVAWGKAWNASLTLTPNPFSHQIEIGAVVKDGYVEIYDLSGRRVRTIDHLPAIWDGRDAGGNILSSGVYLLLLKTHDRIINRGTVVYLR